jgi:hypothetical protein
MSLRGDVRVTAIAVGNELHEHGSVAFNHPFPGVFNGLDGRYDVHPIDLPEKISEMSAKTRGQTRLT